MEQLLTLIEIEGYDRLSEGQHQKILQLVKKLSLDKTTNLVAHFGQFGLIDDEIYDAVSQRALENEKEVTGAKNQTLYSLSYIIKDKEARKIVHDTILGRDVWNCGINGNHAVMPNYLELNKISEEIVWTKEEISVIMGNLEENLNKMETWNRFDDIMFGRDYLKMLTDMLDFTNRVVVKTYGLQEYQPTEKHIGKVVGMVTGESGLFDALYQQDGELYAILDFLARCIDFEYVDKYRNHVDAVINRALLMVQGELTSVLSFIAHLAKKHIKELLDENTINKLTLLLRKYSEIDYRETDLYLPTAFESLRIIAEALNNENVAKGAIVDYWLNEKKVNRFH